MSLPDRAKVKLPDINGDNPPFSISFTDWVEKHGFLVRDAWDIKTGKWQTFGWMQLLPLQHRLFDFSLRMNGENQFNYSTVLYSTIKKSGKTTNAAAIGSWYAEVAPPGSEIYVIANDLESAEGRVMADMKYHALQRGYRVKQYEIHLPNGTFVKALAQNYKSVAGSRHALTLFDELWGVTTELTRRTYEEMTPISTIPHSLRFIATYAGFINESDLLWDLYVNGVGKDEHEDGRGRPINEMIDLPVWENGRQLTYWNHEPVFPWQTDTYYSEQRESLRPAAYLRLHENRWVTTHEEFVPQEWWAYAENQMEGSAELWKDHPYSKFPVYIAVDAAPKRDSTAVSGVTYDPANGTVIELFHKIWTPANNVQLDLDETVSNYLRLMVKAFNVAVIGYDPAHLYQLMLNLSKDHLPVKEFVQSVSNMTKASQNLFDLLKFRRFRTYKDEEARIHIQNTVAQAESNGIRIVKHPGSFRKKPVDYAVALAMAAYLAVSSGGIDVTQPLVVVSPFSDLTAWKNPSDMVELPWQFRNN